MGAGMHLRKVGTRGVSSRSGDRPRRDLSALREGISIPCLSRSSGDARRAVPVRSLATKLLPCRSPRCLHPPFSLPGRWGCSATNGSPFSFRTSNFLRVAAMSFPSSRLPPFSLSAFRCSAPASLCFSSSLEGGAYPSTFWRPPPPDSICLDPPPSPAFLVPRVRPSSRSATNV